MMKQRFCRVALETSANYNFPPPENTDVIFIRTIMGNQFENELNSI